MKIVEEEIIYWLHSDVQVSSFFPFPVTAVWDGSNVLLWQHAKRVVSDSPGLVDFAIGLVILVLNLPDGQVLTLGEIQIIEGL